MNWDQLVTKRYFGIVSVVLLQLIYTADASQPWPACDRNIERSLWSGCVGSELTVGSGLYVGQFVNGAWEGEGTQTFSSGAKYQGNWKAGMRHGEGVFTPADGSKPQAGTWKNGEFLIQSEVSVSKEKTKPPPPSPLELAKQKCRDLGFKDKTEKLGECILRLSK